MYNVFILRVGGQVEHSTQDNAPKLPQLQSAVGGYIETVPYFTNFTYNGKKYKRGRAYANEEGLLRNLPLNITASVAWRTCFRHATSLVGDVIFFAKGK